MALFRKNKKPTPPSPGAGGRPWLDHGLADGDTVSCGRCGRELRVKLHRGAGIMVSSDGALGGLALICTECGRLICEDCSVAASDNPYTPKCDRCRGGVVPPMSR